MVSVCLLTSPCGVRAQMWEWAKGSADTFVPAAVFTGEAGGIYLCGNFGGSITFGSLAVASPFPNNSFIAKFDSSGNAVWLRYIDYTGAVNYTGNTVFQIDRYENVYMAGVYLDSLGFGGITLTSPGYAMFLAKYGKDGNLLWAKSTPCSDALASLEPLVMGIDAQCRVYVAGYTWAASLPITVTTADSTIASIDAYDFMEKYDSSGNLLWANGITVDSANISFDITSMAIDNNSHLYITGSAWGFVSSLSGIGQFYLTKYDSAGNPEWSKIESPRASIGTAIVIGSDGLPLVLGYYAAGVQLGDSSFSGSGGMFLAKFDTSGSVIWGRSTYGQDLDDPGVSFAYRTQIDGLMCPTGLATDLSGNIYATGYYESPVCFGGFQTSTFNTGSNVFLVKYDANGNAQWCSTSHGHFMGADVVSGISVDGYGNVVVAGNHYGQPLELDGLAPLSAGVGFYAKFGSSIRGTPTGWSLFPNPAGNSVTLQSTDIQNYITNVSLYDVAGRNIWNYACPNPASPYLTLNLPVADGVYILKVAVGDGVDCLRVVVKR